MIKRKVFAFLIALSMLFTFGAAQRTFSVALAAKSADDIAVKLISDNKIIDTQSVVVNGRTLIPVRKLLESVNATVDWDESAQRIDLVRNDKKISMHIGSNILTTSDGDKVMDIAPVLYNGNTTYAPIRAVAEEFGLSVDWDGGTKTILVTSPEGCPYVDLYDGMTVKEYIDKNGMSQEEFEIQSGLDYQVYKDKLFVQAENDISVSWFAKTNNMTFEELKSFVKFDDSITSDTPWGIAMGSITFGSFLNAFVNPESLGVTLEETLELMKSTYFLGNEYTLETKFRFVRPFIESFDYDKTKPQSDIIIPDLNKGYIKLDFLYKIIDKVGNGKLKLDYYTLPYGQVGNRSRVEDGIWYPFSSHLDNRVAYSFSMLDVVTVDGNSADEINAFYQEFKNALLANDFRFVKNDEDGYAHYVKDTQEFKIKNTDNKSIDISAATIYLSCCALGSN